MRISATGVLLSRPGGEGTLVIRRVVEGSILAWHDVQQPVDAIVAIEPGANRRTVATVAVEGSWSRVTLEGLRPVPREAVSRLRALCQTAADL